MKQEMKIALYKKEADYFEKMLNEIKADFIHDYLWHKEQIPKTDGGWRFIIRATEGIVFYFIGQRFERLMMKYHVDNYAFRIIEDDE